MHVIESLLKIAGIKFEFVKLGNSLSQTSGFVPGFKTWKPLSVNAA